METFKKVVNSRMKPHGAEVINFKYCRSRMETFEIMLRNAWSRMKPQRLQQILQEPHGHPLKLCLEMLGAAYYTFNTVETVWRP